LRIDAPVMREGVVFFQGCQSYSDSREAYLLVFPEETHESVGKASGQTNHMKRR